MSQGNVSAVVSSSDQEIIKGFAIHSIIANISTHFQDKTSIGSVGIISSRGQEIIPCAQDLRGGLEAVINRLLGVCELNPEVRTEAYKRVFISKGIGPVVKVWQAEITLVSGQQGRSTDVSRDIAFIRAYCKAIESFIEIKKGD